MKPAPLDINLWTSIMPTLRLLVVNSNSIRGTVRDGGSPYSYEAVERLGQCPREDVRTDTRSLQNRESWSLVLPKLRHTKVHRDSKTDVV